MARMKQQPRHVAEATRIYGYTPPMQADPTDAWPGSDEKVKILAERYRNGCPLHVPGDTTIFRIKAWEAQLLDVPSPRASDMRNVADLSFED